MYFVKVGDQFINLDRVCVLRDAPGTKDGEPLLIVGFSEDTKVYLTGAERIALLKAVELATGPRLPLKGGEG